MRVISKQLDKIRHMRIVPKLIIGYVMLICVPFVVFGYIFYQQMSDNLLDQYLASKQQLLEQAYGNFELELSKIESAYPLFQNNTNLTDYLSGTFVNEWEMIYNYRKEIGPAFTFMYSGNPIINAITIYKDNDAVLKLPPDIMNKTDFSDPSNKESLSALSPDRGLWAYQEKGLNEYPVIHYTQKLYNESYTKEIGLLRIVANDGLLNSFFQMLKNGETSWKMVVDTDGKLIFAEEILNWNSNRITKAIAGMPKNGVRSYYIDQHSYLVNAVQLKKINMTLIEISKVGPMLDLKTKQRWTITVGVLLLAVLSVFYFGIASSITSRIIRLSRHMRSVEDPKLAFYPGQSGTDEVGFLIGAYNKMITRMDELGHKVHRTELMKKEAEIKMLQAQIKPHFLYNTLETMRMMALMKNETEIAEIAFTLGNLLRYSLSKDNDEATLLEELENVRNYISIHRVRIGERLHFEETIEGNITNFRCPRFILQPIIENSILHGLGKMRGNGTIVFKIEDRPGEVVIRISDNGAGIKPDRLSIIQAVLSGEIPMDKIPFTGGIGLFNVNERIKAFFGGSSGIKVRIEERKWTTFELTLEKRSEDSSC
ncbi:hypothetical protein BK120_11915 [Paenibacillus sp. FSL A5-0031]|uniref:sensor histidine kinase n=1 Tax=Paenibacillus sp. FSL A5-0031 TaxID=1920420 RepID=UPI00096FEDEF|nr:histidine kinase [Paenibacillus sp. FSL A5-0031]OME85223.1 hypothetical protein BK120_11915 [Paenibacillus sp. FSL A5-0031]